MLNQSHMLLLSANLQNLKLAKMHGMSTNQVIQENLQLNQDGQEVVSQVKVNNKEEIIVRMDFQPEEARGIEILDQLKVEEVTTIPDLLPVMVIAQDGIHLNINLLTMEGSNVEGVIEDRDKNMHKM